MEYEKLSRALDDLHSRFEQIPLGNSDFQEEHFVIADALTPTRAYRQICLQLQANLNALREAYYEQKRTEIKIAQLRSDPAVNEFDKQLQQIDIEELRWKLKDLRLRVKNFNHSVQLLTGHLERFPRFTRKQFEAGEQEYYELHLGNQLAGVVGAKKDLLNINQGVSRVLPSKNNDKDLLNG